MTVAAKSQPAGRTVHVGESGPRAGKRVKTAGGDQLEDRLEGRG